MVDQIQANYDKLKEIQSRFTQIAEFVDQMSKDVGGKVNALHEQGWQGKGSDAFYREMNDEITPAVLKLRGSLQKSAEVIGGVSQAIREAEEDVQGRFKNNKQ